MRAFIEVAPSNAYFNAGVVTDDCIIRTESNSQSIYLSTNSNAPAAVISSSNLAVVGVISAGSFSNVPTLAQFAYSCNVAINSLQIATAASNTAYSITVPTSQIVFSSNTAVAASNTAYGIVVPTAQINATSNQAFGIVVPTAKIDATSNQAFGIVVPTAQINATSNQAFGIVIPTSQIAYSSNTAAATSNYAYSLSTGGGTSVAGTWSSNVLNGTGFSSNLKVLGTLMVNGAPVIGNPADVTTYWDGVSGGFDELFERSGFNSSLPSGWSWFNPASSTYTESLGRGRLCPDSNLSVANQPSAIVQSAIVHDLDSNWSIVGLKGSICATGNTPGGGLNPKVGVYFQNSNSGSSNMITFTQNSSSTPCTYKFPTGQSSSSVINPINSNLSPLPFHMQIAKLQGSNLQVNLSTDGGNSWLVVQKTFYDGINANQVGVFAQASVMSNSSAAASSNVVAQQTIELDWFRVR